MKRYITTKPARTVALALALSFTIAAGPCSSKEQPKTVADTLVTIGNVKRDLRARGEITPQVDYDISARLLEANRSYKRFIDDELARLAQPNANQNPDPDARRQAVNALVSALRGLQDPGILGIKSENAKKLWREAVSSLNTIIQGLEALRTGGE